MAQRFGRRGADIRTRELEIELSAPSRAFPYSGSVGGEPESAGSWPMGALAIAIRTRLAAGDSAAQHSTV